MRASPGAVYADWITKQYGTLLRWFLILTTYPRLLPRNLYRKGFKFTETINRQLFGKHFRDNGTGLMSVFTVEGHRDGEPHLHLLLADHPQLTYEFLQYLWLSLAGKRTRPSAQHIRFDIDPEVIKHNIGYALKNITWAREPYIYAPKNLHITRVCEKPLG